METWGGEEPTGGANAFCLPFFSATETTKRTSEADFFFQNQQPTAQEYHVPQNKKVAP